MEDNSYLLQETKQGDRISTRNQKPVVKENLEKEKSIELVNLDYSRNWLVAYPIMDRAEDDNSVYYTQT
jgi:hypothetical protein